VLLFLLLPAVAAAGPVRSIGGPNTDLVGHDEPRLRMPGELSFARARASRSDEMLVFGLQETRPADQTAASGLSFGPLHAESEIVNGRRRMHYHVDGLTLMGGEIGASLGRHRAMLTLHWTSSGD
jgi:hypothetical protein